MIRRCVSKSSPVQIKRMSETGSEQEVLFLRSTQITSTANILNFHFLASVPGSSEFDFPAFISKAGCGITTLSSQHLVEDTGRSWGLLASQSSQSRKLKVQRGRRREGVEEKGEGETLSQTVRWREHLKLSSGLRTYLHTCEHAVSHREHVHVHKGVTDS